MASKAKTISTTLATNSDSLDQFKDTMNQLKEITDQLVQKVKVLETSVNDETKNTINTIEQGAPNPVNSQAVLNYIEKRLTETYAMIAKDICNIQDGIKEWEENSK